MEQQFRDKMSNHEFPLQPSDWEKMQQRLEAGKEETPKPKARFFNFKFIVLAMTIITLLIAILWHWAQPEKVQIPEKEPVTVANKEAFARSEGFLNTSKNHSQSTTVLPFKGRGLDTTKPKTLLHTPDIKAKQRNQKPILTDTIKYKTKKINELATSNNLYNKPNQSPQPLKGSALSNPNKQRNKNEKQNNSVASTSDNQPTVVLPLRGRGIDAQNATQNDPIIKNITQKLKNVSTQLAAEKAYLHLDRTLFKPNEDLWFSMYLRDANTLLPSQQSQILYVDLVAPNGNVQESKTYLVFDGQAAGDFHLDASLKGGIYKLRAYTNWMKNTNEVFEREITLQAVVLPNLSMKLEFERKSYGASDEVVAKFDANTLENKALANTALSFTASLTGNILTTGIAQTNEKGRAYIKFNLPKDLTTNDGIVNITLQHNGQTEAISRAIPIVLNKLDFQLLPEGGEILAASLNRIAFKALNEFGKPADVEGIVKNPKSETVTTFKSFHQGMGAFELIAKEIGTYQVHITKPENITQVFNFQVDTLKKAVLMVDNLQDRLRVKVAANDSRFEECYVVAQMNDKIVYETAINIENNTMQLLDIPTKDWNMGIARITLFDKNGTPCNERLVFINRYKALNISIKTDKVQYQPREKVSMTIKVSDDKGQPVKGNFSLAVADDAQLTFADDKQGHILASLLLESELKGKIEEPNFYFDIKEEKSIQALDYLLLTQGWRRLEWKEVLKAEEIVENYKFKIERLDINIQVISKTVGLPMKDVKMELDNGKTLYTDKDGIVSLKANHLQNVKSIVFNDNEDLYIDVYNRNIKVFVDENGNITDEYNHRINRVSHCRNLDELHDLAVLKGNIKEQRFKTNLQYVYIHILDNEGNIIGRGLTDFQGNYQIPVRAGKYDIKFHCTFCDEKTLKNIDLKGGIITRIDEKIKNVNAKIIRVLSKTDGLPLKDLDVKLDNVLLTTNNEGIVIFPNNWSSKSYLEIGERVIEIDVKEDITLYLDENGEIFGKNGRPIYKYSTSLKNSNIVSLYGRILDNETQKPYTHGAQIALFDKDKKQIIKFTNKKGLFQFDLLAGTYDIEIISEGYRMSKYNFTFSDSSIYNFDFKLIKEDTTLLNKQVIVSADYTETKPYNIFPKVKSLPKVSINGESLSYSFQKNTNPNVSATVAGKVIEKKTEEDAIGAYVKFLQHGVQKALTATDFEGIYSINIPFGFYDIELSYVGMKTLIIKNVYLAPYRITNIDAQLEVNTHTLDNVVVTAYKVPLVQQDNTTAGGTVTSEQIKNMPTRNVTAIVGLTNGVQTNQSGDINIKGARKESTVYMVDGVRVQGGSALPPAQEIDQFKDLGGVPAEFENLENSKYNEKKARFGDLFKKASVGGSGKPGNSGDPAGNLTGSGSGSGSGTSIGGGIGNRVIKNRSKPSRNYNENGDVVVNVCVNADGSIDANSIKVQSKGTTTTSIILRNIATSNAKNYRFEAGEDKQCGTITYRFRVDNEPETYVKYTNNVINKYATTRTFYAPIYNPKEKPEVRNDFRSTIFWKPDLATDDKGEATIEFYNSDALTTFRATLEGIGAKGNVGRAEYRYATNLPLNLSAKMPDKVLTGDVIKIPLSLKNNSENAQKININVTKPSHFEAVGDIPNQVNLAANEAKTLFLSYKVAMQSSSILGESQTFLIETTSDDWSDKFEAKVKTLPRGFPVTQIFSADKLQNSFQLNLRQPVEKTAKLTLTAYPNALDDILQGMERMLRQPSGCFEQVSSSNYPNLLVLDLLRNTQNTRPDVEQRAMDYLKDGYKRLTAYECKSGGFDWWGRDPAHEGLTAYGILEFTDMARVFDVDKNLIDRSVKWLLNRKNNKGGWTLNPQALHGWQNDAVLDAYIVYALASSGYGKEISKEIEAVANTDAAKKDAYTQALLVNTYLSLGDQNNAKPLIDNLLKTQAQDGSFVGNTHSVFHAYGNAFKVETTALVALALMQAEGYDGFLAKAMSFIVQSKSEYGYGNTQSTVMALKALCNYARLQKNGDNGGNIIVLVNDKKVAEKSYSKSQFGKVLITDLEQFMSSEKDNIKVIFEQTNNAIPFDLTLQYASKMPNNAAESPLQFSTSLAQNQAKIGDVVRQTASMKNISKNIVASPIMVVGIPAGMTAQPWQLKQIVERKECAFYEIFNNYIVFYFDEIKPNELINIHLDLRADIGGSYEAPASAAYPYYTNEWRVWSKPEGILVN